MTVITAGDLAYSYQSGATKGDDPKLRGNPDHSLFSRNEKYEVLYLINKFCEKHSLNKASALKTERMIHAGLPATTHSQVNVVAWLEKNWNSYT